MSDPYGYADAPAAPANLATQSMYAGILSLCLAAIAPCLCYMPYFLALPVGAYAIYAATTVQGANDPTGLADKAMATGGMLAGGISALLSLLFLLGVGAYILLIVGLGMAG